MLFIVMLIGNTIPYYITQPSTDNDVKIVSPTATRLELACSLNINIPPGVTITWLHNGRVVPTTTTQSDRVSSNIAMLQIKGFQPSDAGVYQCVFNDTTIGYILRRNITLSSMCVIFYKVAS